MSCLCEFYVGDGDVGVVQVECPECHKEFNVSVTREEVRDLFRQGLSERDVAARTNLSKSTVHRMKETADLVAVRAAMAGGPDGPPEETVVQGLDGKTYPARGHRRTPEELHRAVVESWEMNLCAASVRISAEVADVGPLNTNERDRLLNLCVEMRKDLEGLEQRILKMAAPPPELTVGGPPGLVAEEVAA